MVDKKISSIQLILILIIARLFTLLNFIPIFAEQVEETSILYGELIALPIMIIMMIPTIIFMKKHNYQNIIDFMMNRSKPIGIIIALVYFVIIMISICTSVFSFEFFITNAFFPNSSSLTIILSVVLVLFLASLYRLEAISRTAFIFSIPILLSVVAIILLSFKHFEITNFRPLIKNPIMDIVSVTGQVIAKNTDLIILIFLVPYTKGKVGRVTFGFLINITIIVELLSLAVILVFGKFTTQQTFPFYSLVAINSTKIYERLDGIHLLLWISTAFVKITIYSITSTEILMKIFKKISYKILLLISYIVVLIVALFLSFNPRFFPYLKIDYPYVNIILITIIPLVLCFFKKDGVKKYD